MNKKRKKNEENRGQYGITEGIQRVYYKTIIQHIKY